MRKRSCDDVMYGECAHKIMVASAKTNTNGANLEKHI